jgi:pyruvate/2-oxoglutarate dehydrogenase complex dihydrolipoamide dehydrogenase (E3) component
MDVDFLPRHLIIIGGGYIGLEFAQMYRRFGSEVTIIETGSHLAFRGGGRTFWLTLTAPVATPR